MCPIPEVQVTAQVLEGGKGIVILSLLNWTTVWNISFNYHLRYVSARTKANFIWGGQPLGKSRESNISRACRCLLESLNLMYFVPSLEV